MSALLCLATAVYFEARGEPLAGQMAVAQTIMNRVEDDRYRDTVCGVVYAPDQFSWAAARPTMPNNARARAATAVAEDVLEGETYPTNATHFHSGPPPVWTKHFKRLERIGGHVFYENTTPYR